LIRKRKRPRSHLTKEARPPNGLEGDRAVREGPFEFGPRSTLESPGLNGPIRVVRT